MMSSLRDERSLPSLSVPSGERRRLPRLTVVLTLSVVWLMMWGRATPGTVCSGVLIAFVVAWALPLPRVKFVGYLSVLGIARLFARLAWDILVASIQVAVVALRFGRPPRGAVLRVQLRSSSDLYLTLTGNLCSLVPGSLVVEAYRSTGTLYIHVLDIRSPADIARARESVLDQEAKVLYALASDAEIAAAGLPQRHFGGASRKRREAAERSRELGL